MLLQRRDQTPVVRVDRGTPCHDHQVYRWQARQMASEGLAGKPLETIAVDRAPGLFLGDGQPKTGRTGSGGFRRQYREVGVGRFQRFSKDPLEIPRLGQSDRAWVPIRGDKARPAGKVPD